MDTYTTALRKLDALRNKLSHLKKDTERFSATECLTMSGQIRKNLLEDSDITTEGLNDDDISQKIKTLMDDILAYQNDILSLAMKDNMWDIDFKNPLINDFTQASNSLSTIVEKELKDISSIPDDISSAMEGSIHQHIKTLRDVRHSLSEEQYKVLLIGEYQSGKTTVINALCGGRHVGAIGKGTVTSAVPLTITYGPRDSHSIEWKEKKQFEHILSHMSRHFEGFQLSSFELDDATQRKEWLEKLDEFRNEKDAPKTSESESKYLAICAIILKYYASSELEAFKNSSQNDSFSLDDISEMSKFPKSLESRWLESGSSAFSIKESIFVLAYRIHCYCASKMLRELNCTFVDSPGLFASDYDTEITEEAMTQANAILYVLPYDKQIGKTIKNESLKLMKNKYKHFHRKLLFIGNLQMTEDSYIYEKNKEIVDALFDSKVPIIPLDALMAYYGAIKDSYENGTLYEEDVIAFIERARPKHKSFRNKDVHFSNFYEAWNYKTTGFRVYYELEGNTSPDYLELSNFREFIEELLSFIEKNKAFSLIYSDGIKKMGDELASYRKKVLINYIEPYSSSRNERINFYEKRLNNAKKFDKNATPIINDVLLEEGFIKKLASGSYKVMFTQTDIDGMLDNISRLIYYDKKELFNIRKDKKALEEYLTPRIKNVISDTIKQRFKYWNSLVESEQVKELSDLFTSKVGKLKEKLLPVWKGVFAEDERFQELMTGYVSFPTNMKKVRFPDKEDFEPGFDGKNVTVNSGDIIATLVDEIMKDVTTAVSGIVAWLCMIFATLASNPIGWILAMMGLGGLSVVLMVKGEEFIEDAFVKKMRPDLYKQFQEEQFFTKMEDINEKNLRNTIMKLTQGIVFDYEQLERDKVMATEKPEEEIEAKFFQGIKIVETVNSQLGIYKSFVQDNIHEA